MRAEVIVRPHDRRWADMFNSESQLVLRALGDNALFAHHIGSTAIESIVAKPIIDMLIEVRELGAVDPQNPEMIRFGYEPMGEFGIPLRRYFRKNNPAGQRAFHVHAYPTGNEQVTRHLAFRDFLRSHPEWAIQYSRLKSTLAMQHPDSMAAYIEGKDAFIRQIDALAMNHMPRMEGQHGDAP
jgi:GrpB-like predicted nucleotidyltransferase (UPF0157 family)